MYSDLYLYLYFHDEVYLVGKCSNGDPLSGSCHQWGWPGGQVPGYQGSADHKQIDDDIDGDDDDGGDDDFDEYDDDDDDTDY